MTNDTNQKTNSSLIRQMLKTVQQHNLITNGDRIVVGVSGGADSVSLLRALCALRDVYNLTLITCHVNHKIRPGAAERDQRFVEDLCHNLGVECHVKEVYVESLAREWGISDEEAGRRVRYDFFNEIAGPNGKIATAHNRNDNAETVMMRFMRGTGLHGLTGIPYRRDNIIRPILDVSRNEIEEYLEEIGQAYITDETNLQPIYTRNKIRLNLIPEIQKEFNPNFVDTLANNISNYRDEDDFMLQCARDTIKKYFEIESDKKIWISKDMIEHEHVAIIKRAIRVAFANVFGVDLSAQAVGNIVDLMKRQNGVKMTIIDDIVASVQYSGIMIQEGSDDKMMVEFNLSTDVDNPVVFHTNNISVRYEIVNADNVVNNSTTFYYPINLCKNGFKFRTRRDGDVLAIAPGIRKKLKKFFIDQKVDAVNRDCYWLLVNEHNEIVWIPGLFGSRLKDGDRHGEFVKFTII
jgi:tRNA(Ile)-lysidine synthase